MSSLIENIQLEESQVNGQWNLKSIRMDTNVNGLVFCMQLRAVIGVCTDTEYQQYFSAHALSGHIFAMHSAGMQITAILFQNWQQIGRPALPFCSATQTLLDPQLFIWSSSTAEKYWIRWILPLCMLHTLTIMWVILGMCRLLLNCMV